MPLFVQLLTSAYLMITENLHLKRYILAFFAFKRNHWLLL